ncbi:hypothetical protein FPZ12_008830 [Amycolatopsis acidicola]|uniref:Uncharacterized protein n=1 Tax=Amycolatopsis acidicola TaxID=2596893 RepID=A0A5N0VBD1_9PSEU|nr:hypothetical protein FPZ12_008830 [Amycolatopsis acidicola]
MAVVAAFAAGCSDGGGGGGGTTTTPPPASSAPATTSSARAECSALVTASQTLLATVTSFVTGQATGDQVRAAVTDLSTSVDQARATVGPETRARLDDAKAALGRLQTAVTAQPPDLQGARTAANDTVSALRDAATLCQSSSPSSS